MREGEQRRGETNNKFNEIVIFVSRFSKNSEIRIHEFSGFLEPETRISVFRIFLISEFYELLNPEGDNWNLNLGTQFYEFENFHIYSIP